MPTLNSKYMSALDVTTEPATTRRWEIRSASSGAPLAWVRWYGPWRQYCLLPCEGTIFNAGCLTSLVEFLNQANQEHKEKHRNITSAGTGG